MVRSLTKLTDCFEKGLLQRGLRQPDLAVKDLNQATFFLNEASDLLDQNRKIIAALSWYNAFFHAARSLLFKDGIKERSHYCIARYIEENYVKNKKIKPVFLNAFETIMNIRHTAQYSTEKIEIEEDLAELCNLCKEMITNVELLIK